MTTIKDAFDIDDIVVVIDNTSPFSGCEGKVVNISDGTWRNGVRAISKRLKFLVRMHDRKCIFFEACQLAHARISLAWEMEKL